MVESWPALLSLANDVLQSIIVIFGVSVVLYNLRHSLRDRVTRAFNALVLFTVVVFLCELMATRTTASAAAERWVRLGWVGIAMVPATQFHLADALLATTGDVSRRRRLFVRVCYLLGAGFFLLALFSDLLVAQFVAVERAPHMGAGPLFPIFGLYYWLISAASVYFVWSARRRCVTQTTRRRVSMILATFLAAPLSVFPYLIFNSNPALNVSAPMWLLLIVGNLVVSIMFALLTYYIAYFGATSPDRVVRVRLFKFMARVPLAATIVLLVFIAVERAGSLLGLRLSTGLAISIVAAVILIEWAIHAFKRPLERIFQLTDEPEVRRIQELSERLLTTRDLNQYLESVMVAVCEVLHTPTAFLVGFTPAGPELEAVVGRLGELENNWPVYEWRQLGERADGLGEEQSRPDQPGSFFVWNDFWIRSLHGRRRGTLVGILGVQARDLKADLSPAEAQLFERLAILAAEALEDRMLQQEVFAAVEGLLPAVTAVQLRRSAAAFGGTPALTDPAAAEGLVTDPQFNHMVWDALSHYWGGPKLSESPLLRLSVVQNALEAHGGNATRALRDILTRAVEQQRPEGERNMTTAEWILYNILELKFIQGQRVRDVARRLAMSESDLYRKQRVAIENVAQTISNMEATAVANLNHDRPPYSPSHP